MRSVRLERGRVASGAGGAGAATVAGEIALVDREPPVAGVGEVRLRVEACSLCGTDFAASQFDAEGQPLFSGPLRLPVTLGHEVAGTVESVGAGVERLRPGDLVAVESVLACWACDTCRSGQPAQCEQAELLGLTRDGGLADLVAVPARSCFPLAALLDRGWSRGAAAVVGALLEPLGALYSALFLTGRGAAPGDALVVYGLGSLGLQAGALARLAGCSPILGVDRDPARVDWALEHGFDDAWVLDLDRDDAETAARRIAGALLRPGAEVQLDVSGRTDAVAPIAQRLVGAGGRLVVLSRSRRPVSLTLNPWVSAAAAFQGTRGRTHAGAYSRLLGLFAHGRLAARDHVARFVGLEQVPAILAAGAEPQPGKSMVLLAAEAPW